MEGDAPWDEAPAMPDGPIIGLAVLQLVYGVACGSMALLMPVGGMVGAANDPEFAGIPYNWAVGGCMGCVAAGFLGVFAAVFLVGAIGLVRRWRVGWIVALVGCALWCTSCMAPAGAFGFYALLRDHARTAYMVPREPDPFADPDLQ